MWTCMQSSFSEVPLGSVEVTIKAAVPFDSSQEFGGACFERACQWMDGASCIPS